MRYAILVRFFYTLPAAAIRTPTPPFPTPDSNLPTPDSRLPTPDSRLRAMALQQPTRFSGSPAPGNASKSIGIDMYEVLGLLTITRY